MNKIDVVATLLITEEEEEQKDSPGRHSRSGSKTALENKTFNMGLLTRRKTSEDFHRRRESMEFDSNVIPYKKAIHFVKVDRRFMLKEELVQVKVFPMREWLVIKNKLPKLSQDTRRASSSSFGGWRVVVILFLIMALATILGYCYTILDLEM